MPLLKVGVIGAYRGGKSQVINHWLDRPFETESETGPGEAHHIKRYDGLVHDEETVLDICEGNATERLAWRLPSAYKDAAIVMLVYDTSNKGSFGAIKALIKDVKKTSRPDAKFVLVGTHTDKENNTAEKVGSFLQEHPMPHLLVNSHDNRAKLKNQEGLVQHEGSVQEVLDSVVKRLGESLVAAPSPVEDASDRTVSAAPQTSHLSAVHRLAYDKVTSGKESDKDKMIALLEDYVNGGSKRLKGGWGRFFNGHWNRHHIREVSATLSLLKSDKTTVVEAYNTLARITKNKGGSLSQRLSYIKDNYLSRECHLMDSKEEVNKTFFAKP